MAYKRKKRVFLIGPLRSQDVFVLSYVGLPATQITSLPYAAAIMRVLWSNNRTYKKCSTNKTQTHRPNNLVQQQASATGHI